MPVAGVIGRKGPLQTFPAQPIQDPMVGGDVTVIVEIDEIVFRHPAVCERRRQREGQDHEMLSAATHCG
jgi:hypothetical protein